MYYSIGLYTCSLLFAIVFARPQDTSSSSSTPIPIVSQTEVVGPDGSFNYSYESGNGIKFEQSGYVKKGAAAENASGGELREADEDNDDIQVLQGSYSYTAPDGQQISLRYIADENGFQPEGEHLPTTPAVPGVQSAAALAQLQNAPAAEQQQPSVAPESPAAAAAAPEESSVAPSSESTPAPTA